MRVCVKRERERERISRRVFLTKLKTVTMFCRFKPGRTCVFGSGSSHTRSSAPPVGNSATTPINIADAIVGQFVCGPQLPGTFFFILRFCWSSW